MMMGGRTPTSAGTGPARGSQTDLAGAVPTRRAEVNSAVAASLAAGRGAARAAAFCQAKARADRRSKAAASRSAPAASRAPPATPMLPRSPELDGDTLALAAGLVDEMRLGRGPDPDLLAISLSATDYVGHAYGTDGEEMCLQLLELDRELGDFLALLDRRGIDYAVALTADHGGMDIPERERLRGVADAARIDPALDASTMGKALVAKLGPGARVCSASSPRRHLHRPIT